MNTLKNKSHLDKQEEALAQKTHQNKDHYHGIHHFDGKGGHDHIERDEFKIGLEFKMTRRKLIYKLVLTGIFLALTATVSAIDILFEKIALPVGDQLWIDFRFLDIAFICISIATLGPIFASLIAFLNPIIHNLIHGMEHGWITSIIEAPQNLLIVWMVWVVFYLIFRNSPIHRDANKRIANAKRFASLPVMIFLASIIATSMFILGIYLQGLSGQGHSHIHDNIRHGENHHTGEIENVGDISFLIFLAIFAWNVLRYSFAFAIFNVVEWRMRPINHRYK